MLPRLHLTVAAWVLLLVLAPSALAGEASRTVPMEGQVGPYWEQQDMHMDLGSFQGSVPLRANETSARAYLEVEERAVGSAAGFIVRFCRTPCDLNDDGTAFARASGQGPFDLTFSLADLDVLHYRVSVDEGIHTDAHVTGSLVIYQDTTGTDARQAAAETAPVHPQGVSLLTGAVIASGLLVAGALPALLPRLRRWLLGAPLVGLFTRKETLLDHPVRKRLHETISSTPGIHLRGLRRAMDMPPGQVEHHLHKLIQAGFVVAHNVRGYTAHFVPGTIDRRLMASLARVRSETARGLLATIASGEASLGAAAQQVGIALSTASYHVGCLERLGLVEGRSNGTRHWRVTALGQSFLRLMATQNGSGSRSGPGKV